MTEIDLSQSRERWKQVEELFDLASSLDGPAREAVLAQSSIAPGVLEEVRLLLRSFDSKDSFMEEPVCGLGFSIIGSEPELIIGQSIARYQLLGLLGHGGMSDVYLAKDPSLGRRVALKLLAQNIANPELVRRFEREARAASAISHPNVAHIYEIGESNGRHYIAMEFVTGGTLRALLREGPLDLQRSIKIISQVLSALNSAHNLGIIHRDIKPENIICREDGYAKVVDFGIAKPIETRTSADIPDLLFSLQTEPDLLMGTWYYMSPEQLRKQPVDRRTDLWSTGVVLHEMLTGSRPFRSGSFSEVVISILEDEPQRSGATNLPSSVRHVITKALAKDLTQRYQTADEMLADIRKISESDPDDYSAEGDQERKKQSGRTSDPADPFEPIRRVSGGRAHTLGQRVNTIATSLRSVWSRFSLLKRLGSSLFFALLLIGTVFVTYFALSSRRRAEPSIRELNPKFERVNLLIGDIKSTALSPDGHYVASVTTEAGKETIQIMELATLSPLRIVPPSGSGYTGLVFSTDSTYLYYLETKAQGGTLYRVSKLGGSQRKILEEVNTPVGFSPDGGQIAFVRHNTVDDTPELTVASADGSSLRIIAKRTRADADTFVADPRGSGPVWGPDGKTVVCATLNVSRNPQEMNLEIINLATGQSQRLNSQPWFEISSIGWLKDGSALIVSAKNTSTASSQLIWISYPQGIIRKITNDPNNYIGVTSTNNSNQILSLSVEESSSVWLIPSSKPTDIDSYHVKQSSGVADVRSLANGGFVYSVFDGEYLNLWTQDVSGSVRQLTFEHNDNYRPAISPDQRFIVFVSSRDGLGSIWRMNMDGTNQVRLTLGPYEDMPTVTPDGKWVIYRTGIDIRKVSIDGGASTKLIPENAFFPVVSADGRRLAFFTNETPESKHWVLKIYDISTLKLLKRLDLPDASNPFDGLQWGPQGDGLVFVNSQGAENLWWQPVDGAASRQLTQFKDAEIQSFTWSAKSPRIVCVRRTKTTVPVLVQLFGSR